MRERLRETTAKTMAPRSNAWQRQSMWPDPPSNGLRSSGVQRGSSDWLWNGLPGIGRLEIGTGVRRATLQSAAPVARWPLEPTVRSQ